MRKINFIFLFLFIGFTFVSITDLMANCEPFGFDCCPDPGTCGSLGQPCPDCDPVPLDGGLSALLLAGVAFGIKKVKGKINL